MDIKNLLYNGNFSAGASCWSGSGLTVSGGVCTLNGNLYNSQPIIAGPNSIYRLKFDLRVNTKDGNPFYIALIPHDSAGDEIYCARVLHSNSGVDTTLAVALNNGDTTVTVTDASRWVTSPSYACQIGICTNLAWGYNRSVYNQYYSSKSGNTITLSSPWAGGSYAAGTKVSNFSDGGTYYYPVYIGSSDQPTDWRTYTVDFYGGDNIRYSCCQFIFSTLGYGMNYSMKNISIENISRLQWCQSTAASDFILNKSGVVNTYVNEAAARIRYVKDHTNGSTANTYNHWVELMALDDYGNNWAFNKYCRYSSWGYSDRSYITDGNTSTAYYDEGSTATTGVDAIIDLGFVVPISTIKVWHYYGDGRTYYDHTISVSADGEHWVQIYSGTQAETPEGLTVAVNAVDVEIHKSGILYTTELIEN